MANPSPFAVAQMLDIRMPNTNMMAITIGVIGFTGI
jgi:hypothetical protein